MSGDEPVRARFWEDLLTTGDGLCGIDHDQRIMIWNSAAENLLGYKRSEVFGRHCFEVLAGSDDAGRRVCRSNCANFLSAVRHHPMEACTLRTQTKLGEVVWLSIHSLLLPAPWSKRVALVHFFRDISILMKLAIGVRHLFDPPGIAHECGNNADLESAGMRDQRSRLTSREREVLSLLASGSHTRQIADTLGLSVPTVRNHIGHILGKFRAHTRLEAVAVALRHKLL